MKNIKTTLGICLLTIALAGCSTFETDIEAWWNNPATQAEIQAIETAALQIATAYISSLIAAPAPGATTPPLATNDPRILAQETTEIDALHAKYPDAPVEALTSIVDDAYNKAIATHNATLPK